MGTIRAQFFEFKSEQFTAETWPIAQVLVCAIVGAAERFGQAGCPADDAERLRLEEFANDFDAWSCACRKEREVMSQLAVAQVFQQAFRAWLEVGSEDVVKFAFDGKVESLLGNDAHVVEGHGRNRDRMAGMFDGFVKTKMAGLDLLKTGEDCSHVLTWVRAWARAYMAAQFASPGDLASLSPFGTNAVSEPVCQIYLLASLVKKLVEVCFVDAGTKATWEVANGVRLGTTPHSVIRNDFPPPFRGASVVSASSVTTGPASS